MALGTAALIAGTAYAVYSGERGAAAQRAGVRRQQQAQQQAESAALSQRRQADMAQAAANRQASDIFGILSFEQGLTGGAASTMLGGGTRTNRKPGLLGDV